MRDQIVELWKDDTAGKKTEYLLAGTIVGAGLKLIEGLWKDDDGIVALEYLGGMTIVGLGLVVGLAAVEGAMDAELTELANSVQTLDQSYSFAGQSSCIASKSGSAAFDAPSSISLKSYAAVTQNINVGNCP
jgi:hypothetical protein